MMKMARAAFAFALLLLVQTSYGEEGKCKEEVKDYFKCFVENYGPVSELSELREKVKEAVVHCFVSNGCKKPTLEHDKDLIDISEDNKERIKTAVSCVKESVQNLKSKAEHCVQEHYPSFSFDKFPKEQELISDVRKHFLTGILKIGIALEYPGVCPEESKEKVKECLRSLSEKRKENRDKRMEKIQKLKGKCIEKLSEDCKAKFKEFHGVFSKCACGDIDFEEFNARLGHCTGNDSTKHELLNKILKRGQEKFCHRADVLVKFLTA